MSIASQIEDYADGLSDAYAMVAQRGGTIPAQKNMANLDTAIATIPSGGGSSVGIPREISAQGVFQMPSSNYAFSVPSGVTAIGDNAMKYAFDGSRYVTSADFSPVVSLGRYALDHAFFGNRNLASASFTHLETVATYAFNNSFSNSGLTTISFPALTQISGGYSMVNAFNNCSALTSISFPELTTITGASSFSSMCYGCSNLSSVSFPKLASISGSQVFSQAFSNTAITSISFPSLTTVNGANMFSYAFDGCSSLATVSFPELVSASLTENVTYAFRNAFQGCTSLTSVTFPKLENAYDTCFSQAFKGCTSLTTVSFPSLTAAGLGSKTNQFNGMLQDCTGVTVHFPAALQSTIGSWASVQRGFGGTNTTVLFDL